MDDKFVLPGAPSEEERSLKEAIQVALDASEAAKKDVPGCLNCRFSMSSKATGTGAQSALDCRKMLPQTIAYPTTRRGPQGVEQTMGTFTWWPIVMPADWCGQWERKASSE